MTSVPMDIIAVERFEEMSDSRVVREVNKQRESQ